MLAVANGLGLALQPPSFMEAGQPGPFVVRRDLEPPLKTTDTMLAWRADARPLRSVIATLRRIAADLMAGAAGPQRRA
jgi:DNA-binding transcriptional LysR family regulator